jgi:polysaccharide deacetylase
MLEIKIPNFCVPEIEYTCFVVFTEWLGIDYEITTAEQNTILISSGNTTLQLNTSFFIKASNNWLNKETMPELPLKNYNLNKLKTVLHNEIHICETELPVLYGIPEITVTENNIACGIDLFGGIFFMLSRYEEIVVKERDEHDRFSAKSSIAYKENFLFRPIANEYLELLFALLKHLSPPLQRKKMQFKLCPTHDVDVPFTYLNISFLTVMRRMFGDVLKRKSVKKAFQTYMNWFHVAKNELQYDPVYTFDFIMTESEKHDLKSAFYFLPSSSPEYAIKYSITFPQMQSLLKEIDERKHVIGIHGHYGTYLNKDSFSADVVLLKEIMSSCRIEQPLKGGRQHYLQWKNPETFQIWESAGMEYDSSLGFADSAGFRCGTCYEYPVYDCIRHKKLCLKECPLVAMECSVTDSCYMGLGWGTKALKLFKTLKDVCCYYKGNFIILFHNNSLITAMQKDFYKQVLDC